MKEEIINFYSEVAFDLPSEAAFAEWIRKVIASEGKLLGEISFIFCEDEYLLTINQEYLNHDTYTDIITFDNTMGNTIGGDVFISIERVRENAEFFGVLFEEELKRVMVHGVLHLCGYLDKTLEEQKVMRDKENVKIEMFHVEQ